MASHPHLREKLGPVDEVVSMQLSGIKFDYMSYSHALAVLTVQPRLRIYKLKSNLKRNAQRFPQPDYRLYPHAEASSPEKSPEHRQDLRPGDECIPGLTSLCHNLLGVVDPEADGLDQLKGDLLRQARDISKEHRSIVNSSVLRTLQYLLLGVPPEGNQAGGVSGSSNGGEVENWRTHRAIEPVRREGAMANLLQRLRDTRGSILGDEDSPNSSWRWCAFIDGKRMPWPSSLSKEWVFCVAAGLEGKFGCQMVEGLRVDATHDDIVIRFSTSRSSEDLVSQFPINQTLGVTTPARRKHLAEAAVGILLALVGEDHTEAHQYISLAPESHTPPEADAEDPSFALLNVNVQWAARLPAAEAPLFEVPRPHEAPTQTDLTAVVGTLTPWSGGCQAKASCCCSTNMVYSVDKNAVAELQSIDELVVAVSYVWDQYDDKELVITLAKLSRSTGVDKFWVDRWCINQSCQWHKEIMIPEMGLIYSNCEFVIAFGSEDAVRSMPVEEP
ncbi:hypothetical protein CkaCkLH20_06056 [Colletotrichum karsti]|uniref:Heterokaryon incompatibility domain-containing protein n=1 Tax=Colletotrichum karsti TaxID=1095194 RepID=A0A9P6I596_9PEZI|nr:uncharacterized protein CkaCkLH20_06056 [Colletotrichum karsti]KAF9876648.1 hypothetical protein CkaCkLH20_06056 [Colletotrichum karsti]